MFDTTCAVAVSISRIDLTTKQSIGGSNIRDHISFSVLTFSGSGNGPGSLEVAS